VTSSGKPGFTVFTAQKNLKSHINHQIGIVTQKTVNSIHNAKISAHFLAKGFTLCRYRAALLPPQSQEQLLAQARSWQAIRWASWRRWPGFPFRAIETR
jgi:hypothetical protein